MIGQIDLKQRGVVRPEKICWRFIGNFPSHSTRSFVKKLDEVLPALGISWEYQPVSKEQYVEWLKYYREKMTEKGYQLLASEAWYDRMIDQGRSVEGLFFYREERMIGSTIIVRQNATFASLAFKASEEVEAIHHGSLGAAIDYYYIRTMQERGVKTISGGRSRNIFTSQQDFGYVRAKSNMYYPSIPNNPVWTETVSINDDQPVVFYGLKDNKLCMVVRGFSQEEVQGQFHTGEIPIVLVSPDSWPNDTIAA